MLKIASVVMLTVQGDSFTMLHFELAHSIHNQLVLMDSGYIIFKASPSLYNICQSNMDQKSF